jgi:hypothetical protein
VCAGAVGYQLIFYQVVDEQPIGRDVAFTFPDVGTRQGVILISRGQGLFPKQSVDHVAESAEVETALPRQFRVAAELGR